MASGLGWPLREAGGCWPDVVPRGENVWPQESAGRNSLPRSLSLKSRTEISELLEKGRRFRAGSFTLVWQPADQFRYGVFLSRSFASAHRRNRIKRLYREALRLSRGRLNKTGKLAFLPRRFDSDPKLEQLITDVSQVFEQINSEG